MRSDVLFNHSRNKRINSNRNILAKVLVFAMLLCSHLVLGAADPGQSTINSGIVDNFKGLVNTVTVQAVDAGGNLLSVGGEIFILRLEQHCSVTSDTRFCVLDPTQDNVPGLPMFIEMTDNGDGTYTADYTITGPGTVAASVELVGGNGNWVEYWDNKYLTGTPQFARVENQDINYDWGTGPMTPLSTASNAGVRWQCKLKPSFSETYTIDVQHDAAYVIFIDGVMRNSAWAFNGSQSLSFTYTFEAGKYHDLRMDLGEGGGTAFNIVEWSSPSQPKQFIPASALYLPERVGGVNAIHLVEVIDPTVPATSTIESFSTTHIAGTVYTITMQSRNDAGVALNVADDNYSVDLSRSDGLGSEQFLPATSHVSGGRYTSSMTPIIAGTYTMTVEMTNAYTAKVPGIQIEVSGSPYDVTVYPGQVDPTKCYTDIIAPLTETAGDNYLFEIQFIDLWDNVHFQTMTDDIAAGMTVSIVADYVNHDNWPSPIDVEDLEDWQTIYGVQKTGTATDTNNGKMTGRVNIERAGSYILTVQVNGVDIIDSPFSYLEIEPAGLHAPACVAVEVPEVMYAGYEYEFLVQGRDQYSNNIDKLLEDAVGADFSAQYIFVDDNTEFVDADVSNYASNAGVYQVDVALSKTQIDGDYNLDLLMDGFEVPTPAIKVLPCTNFIAVGLGRVAPPDNINDLGTLDYTIKDELVTVNLPSVRYYCEHEPIQHLLSATVTLRTGEQVMLQGIEELAEYGIILEGLGAYPSISVYTEEINLGPLSFELVISATVVEETAWFDTTYIVINYIQPYLYQHQDREVVPPPQFDPRSVSQLTLKMQEDSQGRFILSPLVFNCADDSWEKTLPAIFDEDKGQNFDIRVSLGQAVSFLTYEPYLRLLSFEVPQLEPKPGNYSVVIDLINSIETVTRYVIDITYECQETEPIEEPPLDSYELIYDEDGPIPYIHSISPEGLVKIRFDKEMQPRAALLEKESFEYQEQRVLQETETDIDLITEGAPNELFQNFTLIHNTTVRLNGTWHQSFNVAIEPFDQYGESDCTQKLSFEWEVRNFSPDELTLQLYFDWPECVSSSTNVGDTLVVTFYDQRLFKDSEDRPVWPNTQLRKTIRRQINMSGFQSTLMTVLATISTSIVLAAGLSSLLTSLVMKRAWSLGRFIRAFKGLQLVVASLFIRVYMVAHAEAYLFTLQRLVTFGLFEPKDLSMEMFGVDKTDPIDMHFESGGYETSTVLINIGPALFLIVLLVTTVSLVTLFGYVSPETHQQMHLKEIFDGVWPYGAIEFIDFVFLIGAIACAIDLYMVDSIDTSGTILSLTLLSMAVPYLILVHCCLWHKKRQTQTKSQNDIYLSTLKEDLHETSIGYSLFSFMRRLALAAVLTFGRTSFLAQILFINYSSILTIMIVAMTRPYPRNTDNRFAFSTELTILVLLGFCLTQTDFIRDPEARHWAGWFIIGVLFLYTVVTFGFTLICDLRVLFWRAKLGFSQYLNVKKELVEIEFRKRLELYRKKILDDYNINQKQSSVEESEEDQSEESLQVVDIIARHDHQKDEKKPLEVVKKPLEEVKKPLKEEKKQELNLLVIGNDWATSQGNYKPKVEESLQPSKKEPRPYQSSLLHIGLSLQQPQDFSDQRSFEPMASYLNQNIPVRQRPPSRPKQGNFEYSGFTWTPGLDQPGGVLDDTSVSVKVKQPTQQQTKSNNFAITAQDIYTTPSHHIEEEKVDTKKTSVGDNWGNTRAFLATNLLLPILDDDSYDKTPEV